MQASLCFVAHYTGWLKKVSCCTVSTAYFFEPPCIYSSSIASGYTGKSIIGLMHCIRLCKIPVVLNRSMILVVKPGTMFSIFLWGHNHKFIWGGCFLLSLLSFFSLDPFLLFLLTSLLPFPFPFSFAAKRPSQIHLGSLGRTETHRRCWRILYKKNCY